MCKKSAHKRIVWGCCWTADGSHLFTVARDGICKVWRLDAMEGAVDLICVHSFTPFAGAAVTAVDVCKGGALSAVLARIPAVDPGALALVGSTTEAWMVALGAETGDLQVWRVSKSNGMTGAGTGAECVYESHALLVIPDAHAHGATVRRIRWRPQVAADTHCEKILSYELATCGEDRTVRVHKVLVPSI